MQRKYHHSRLVNLGALRRGSYRERVLLFFSMFGVNENSYTIWRPDEVCAVIGWLDPDGNPRTDAYRRTVRDLVASGALARVEDTIRGFEVYSYRVEFDGLPEKALDVINAKTPKSTVYCNLSDVSYLMGMERLEDLPNIYLIGWKERVQWHEHLRELADFARVDTWEFWSNKLDRALAAKNHPLRGIQDRDVRIQVALSGLEKGLARNLRNPNWQVDKADAWALDRVSRSVGREPDWECIDDKSVEATMKKYRDQGKLSLRDQVMKFLKQSRPKSDSTSEGDE